MKLLIDLIETKNFWYSINSIENSSVICYFKVASFPTKRPTPPPPPQSNPPSFRKLAWIVRRSHLIE